MLGSWDVPDWAMFYRTFQALAQLNAPLSANSAMYEPTDPTRLG